MPAFAGTTKTAEIKYVNFCNEVLAPFSSLGGRYEPAQLLDVSTPINRTRSPPSDLVTVGVK